MKLMMRWIMEQLNLFLSLLIPTDADKFKFRAKKREKRTAEEIADRQLKLFDADFNVKLFVGIPAARFRLRRPKRTHATIRSSILDIVNARQEMRMARDIACDANLPYKQVIDALDRLYNMEKVHREGRKFAAKWGPVAMKEKQVEKRQADAALLDSVFRNFCRR